MAVIRAAVQSIRTRLPPAALLGASSLPRAAAGGATNRISDVADWGVRSRRALAAAVGGYNSPVFLLFGAAGGIGSALARRLAAEVQRPRLVLSDVDEGGLKALQQQLSGAAEVVLPADALVPEQVDRVVCEAMEKYGRLDGVSCTAGNVVAKSTLATSLSDLEEVVRLNLYTSFNVLQASVKAMLAASQGRLPGPSDSPGGHNAGAAGPGSTAGGSIVLVSAALASHGVPNYEAMSAAKAGVEGLARSAAATYAAHDIRVNCVAPGLTATRQTEQWTQQGTRVARSSAEMHPMKQYATPEDVASAIAFLLHPDNAFVTGQALAVDGGLSRLSPSKVQG